MVPSLYELLASCINKLQSVSVVSQVVSLSTCTSFGCRYELMSAHPFTGRPRFLYPCFLVAIAGLHFEMSPVQPSSWRLAIIPAFIQYVLLCLRIRGVIPLAANKSSALWVASTMWSTHGSSSPSVVVYVRGVQQQQQYFLSCSLRLNDHP